MKQITFEKLMGYVRPYKILEFWKELSKHKVEGTIKRKNVFSNQIWSNLLVEISISELCIVDKTKKHIPIKLSRYVNLGLFDIEENEDIEVRTLESDRHIVISFILNQKYQHTFNGTDTKRTGICLFYVVYDKNKSYFLPFTDVRWYRDTTIYDVAFIITDAEIKLLLLLKVITQEIKTSNDGTKSMYVTDSKGNYTWRFINSLVLSIIKIDINTVNHEIIQQNCIGPKISGALILNNLGYIPTENAPIAPDYLVQLPTKLSYLQREGFSLNLVRSIYGSVSVENHLKLDVAPIVSYIRRVSVDGSTHEKIDQHPSVISPPYSKNSGEKIEVFLVMASFNPDTCSYNTVYIGVDIIDIIELTQDKIALDRQRFIPVYQLLNTTGGKIAHRYSINVNSLSDSVEVMDSVNLDSSNLKDNKGWVDVKPSRGICALIRSSNEIT